MELSKAKHIADRIVNDLRPFCERIEIAGSIRRQKADVKDIEVVCIPKRNSVGYLNTIQCWKKVKGEAHGKYTQRELPDGIKLDIFRATADNWGSILMIRTGDWEFSKIFMGTCLPAKGYKCAEGLVIDSDGIMVMVSSEEQLFDMAGIPYIEPEERNITSIRKAIALTRQLV